MAKDHSVNLREVLKLGNAARKAAGKKALRGIPKGKLMKNTDCPLAHLLDGGDVAVGHSITFFKVRKHAEAAQAAWGTAFVASNGYKDTSEATAYRYNAGRYSNVSAPIFEGWYGVRNPTVLSQFVYEFDGGLLPQYEEQ